MYEETDSFDPNSMIQPPDQEHGSISLTNYTFELDNNNNHRFSAQELSSAAMEIQLQNHLEMSSFNSLFMSDSSSNQVLAPFSSSSLPADPNNSYDFLSLYQLSKCSAASSFLPNSSISFSAGGGGTEYLTADAASASNSSIICDPILYLNNLPPQPPLIRDLFQSLPVNGYGSLFGGGGGDDHIEAINGGGFYQDCDGEQQQLDDGVMEFNFNMGCLDKGIRKNGKVTKQFVNERQRRVHVKDTYQTLRDLVPNPTKKDRASIVADAIDYIKELMRSVNELNMLVEKKRFGKDRNNIKRLKSEEEYSMENGHENSFRITKPLNGSSSDPSADHHTSFNNGNGSLRSSWLQRKSKDTEVDVQIIDDEVTIKLVQRKRMNRLLYVSKVLDELQLDLHHVAGGHVGDYYSFLFNTKIHEGSCVYASAIANRVMEVVEGPNTNASTPSTGCY